MKQIISSESHYIGEQKSTGESIVGEYSTLEELGCVDIQYFNMDWEDEVDYFKSFLSECIEKYEKQYNTTVLEVALCGTVGLWNGKFVGGKITTNNNVLASSNSIESIEVFVNDNKEINIQFNHHDGSHSMGIYFITRNTLKKTGYLSSYNEYGDRALDADFFEKLYEAKLPLKLPKNNQYYVA